MADVPPLDAMLRQAFEQVDDDDVRLFYAYFDELKGHVRRYLSGKARMFPGDSHVAQSALFSLFCDLSVQQIPLQDVDEYGYPRVQSPLCDVTSAFFRGRGLQRSGSSDFDLTLGFQDALGDLVPDAAQQDHPQRQNRLRPRCLPTHPR